MAGRIKQLQVAKARSNEGKDCWSMALDVYVGPLTRYYTGEWENVGDRSARGSGAAASRGPADSPVGSAPTGRPPMERPKDADVVRARVLDWREALGRSLGDRIAAPLDWDEGAAAPYFTGRPGWDGFGSLVLWAAYAEHPALRLPLTLPEAWDDDLALIRSNSETFRSRYSHLVRNVELWLPCEVRFVFEGEDVDGRRIVVGSAQTLLGQLADLNAATWKAGEAEAQSWSRRPPTGDASLELQARYAFAVMTGLVRQAVEHRLPIKLDY